MALAHRKSARLGMALVMGVLAIWTPKETAAADQVRYTSDQVSLEADQEILKLRFHGGSTRRLRTYALMGDGRLSIFGQKDASAPPELVGSVLLSDDELSAVVGLVMRSRLYALDTEQLKTLRNFERTPGPYISGAGSLKVEIRLSLFPGTAPDGNDELHSTFGVGASDLGEGAYPSVTELAAIREIVAGLRRVETRVKATTETHP